MIKKKRKQLPVDKEDLILFEHLCDTFKKIGFEIKLKPFIQRSDGSAKGDWDVGITLDMIDYAEDVDAIVLASGDGDFDLVIGKIRNDYNISVEIYGVPNLTAQSLIDSATKFIPIEGNLLLSM